MRVPKFFSEIIFKLYSSTLFDTSVSIWNIIVELTGQTAACEFCRTGNSQSNLTKTTGYEKTTVYKAVAEFDALDEVGRIITSHKKIGTNENISCMSYEDDKGRLESVIVEISPKSQG